MNKIFIFIIFLLLNNCSGYKPILTSKDISFNINKIEINDTNKISNRIKKRLDPYTNLSQKKTNLSLRINSSEKINVIAKDSKGNDSVYEMIISVNMKIINEEQNEKIVKFQEKFNFNNQSNKFELEQYKKNIRSDLIDKIIEKLILNLRLI